MRRRALSFVVLVLSCRRAEPAAVETETAPSDARAPTTPSASLAASASGAPSTSAAPSAPCPGREAAARTFFSDAGKAAAKKDWAAATTAYDAAVKALADCPPLEARALGERGYVKLRAKELDAARADLNAARDLATDDELLGAIHFNLALVADAKKETSTAFEETALSLAFRKNATVDARLSSCGIRNDDAEAPAVRYATAADACKALQQACASDASAGLCEGKFPCLLESRASTAPWPIELPNDGVAGGASNLTLVDRGEGDAVYAYPAGVRVESWRCGGAGTPVVKVSGSAFVVVYEGTTGNAIGPGCDPGNDVASYAAISTKRHVSVSFVSISHDGKPVCR